MIALISSEERKFGNSSTRGSTDSTLNLTSRGTSRGVIMAKIQSETSAQHIQLHDMSNSYNVLKLRSHDRRIGSVS